MNILLLGGTRFVGRHIVEAALQHGHSVSTFTRGNNPLPGTESLVGDRKNGNLEALEGRTWDAVVDVNAYIPREVREATKVLKGRVGRYAFISTVSVYQESSEPRSEASPLLELSNPTVEGVTGETYGGLKVLCEREVERAFGEKGFIVRPHRPLHLLAAPFCWWGEGFGAWQTRAYFAVCGRTGSGNLCGTWPGNRFERGLQRRFHARHLGQSGGSLPAGCTKPCRGRLGQ